MKPITNTSRTAGGITRVLMTRVIGGCQHLMLVEYPANTPRQEAARHIWRGRRTLQIAVMQHRDAIRISQGVFYD